MLSYNRRTWRRSGRMLLEEIYYEKEVLENHVFSFFLAVLGFS
jgi:hypothetical protein